VKRAGFSALALPVLTNPLNVFVDSPSDYTLEVHLFSKHLQFLDIQAAAKAALKMGFAGLDLTVRPKGHIQPENVRLELPRAFQSIKEAGLKCDMITTAIGDVSNLHDAATIETAAAAGVKYYRSNWFKYKDHLSLLDSLDFYKKKVSELAQLNRANNIIGCYQNHSGTKIGASIWEIDRMLQNVDAEYFGVQYDIRHAVAEGGRGWSNGLELIKDKIKNIVLKDFYWGKVAGKWKIVNVPIGEGMVDFDAYFKRLKSYGLKPPVSLHCEYPLGGAEKGRRDITIDKEEVFEAMKKDLLTIQEMWTKA